MQIMAGLRPILDKLHGVNGCVGRAHHRSGYAANPSRWALAAIWVGDELARTKQYPLGLLGLNAAERRGATGRTPLAG